MSIQDRSEGQWTQRAAEVGKDPEINQPYSVEPGVLSGLLRRVAQLEADVLQLQEQVGKLSGQP